MKIKYSLWTSAKRRLCFSGIAFFLCIANADGAKGDYEKLLLAVESDNLEEFNRLLDNGANPNESITTLNRNFWVVCLAAQKESDAWLRAIKARGGDIHQTRQELLSDGRKARYANALLCSVLNIPLEPFKYLLENDAAIENTVCPLCKQETSRRTFLEHITRFRQFNKSAWLLENYPESKQQINDMVIWNLESQPALLNESREDGFWKTVDIIRSLGYEVNPKAKP